MNDPITLILPCTRCTLRESTQCSLSAPPDGTILLEHDDLWQIGTYTCNEGYTLVGEPVRFCIDGIWNGTEPECVKREYTKSYSK